MPISELALQAQKTGTRMLDDKQVETVASLVGDDMSLAKASKWVLENWGITISASTLRSYIEVSRAIANRDATKRVAVKERLNESHPELVNTLIARMKKHEATILKLEDQRDQVMPTDKTFMVLTNALAKENGNLQEIAKQLIKLNSNSSEENAPAELRLSRAERAADFEQVVKLRAQAIRESAPIADPLTIN
jgi:hypothetical protein